MFSMSLCFKFATLAFAVILLPGDVTAAPSDDFHLSARADIPKGYRSEQLRVTGTIGGIQVNHTGTIDEVFGQLESENPGFNVPNIDSKASSVLETRSKDKIYCIPIAGWNWAKVNDVLVNNLINRLQTSEILLCNDSDKAINPFCVWIASYAVDISKRCHSTYNDARPRGLVGGQEFDTDGFNVIVRKDKC
ncbi:hypothetical protein IFR05_001139 [Cadophora sp. M221]|nr:hypothetical protein IFR05_001139 [Cadophora sp. M221]